MKTRPRWPEPAKGWEVNGVELPDWPILVRRELADAGITDESAIESLSKLVGIIAEDAINAERNRYNASLKGQADAYNMSLSELQEAYKVVRDMVMPLLNLLGMSPFEKIVSVAVEMPDGDIRVVHVGGGDAVEEDPG